MLMQQTVTARARVCKVLLLLVTAAVIPLTAPGADPLDWPSWRGPRQNGTSTETGLIDSFDIRKKTNVLWAKKELATRSTPIVMNGKLYSLARSDEGTPQEGERVYCVDAATGELIWETKFGVFLSDVPDTRVAWSNVAGDPETGRIYAQGVCGLFLCLDGETGKIVWQRSLSEEFGLLSTYGGRTNVPILFEDLVLISAVMTNWGEYAVPAHRFLAMDKSTGEVVWHNATTLRPDDTTYSTPVICTFGGQAALVFGSGDGYVWAFQPRTGVPIWKYQLSLRGLNVTPIVEGNTVYMSQSEENPDDNSMGSLAAIDGTGHDDISKTGEVWRIKQVMVGKCSKVLVGDRIYALDDGNLLYTINKRNGEVIGEPQRLRGTIARASLLYADDKLYACTTSACHIFKPTEDGLELIGRPVRFADGEEAHGSPIVSHGRIYLPTTESLYCLALADQKTSAPAEDVSTTPYEETPADKDQEPTHVQLVPAESLIRPGEKVQFTARLFNKLGQEIEKRDVTFSVDNGGQIDKEGLFTAESSTGHAGVNVTAKVGALKGAARIRVVPPLPWSWDFSDTVLTENKMNKLKEGDPPLTWIGCRYRHKVREMDGKKVLVKVTTIPKGTRSQGWFGQTDLHDYTVEADVRGATKDGKLPDIGIIAQRYTLDLMGESQQVQIRSWTPQLERFSKSVKFPWKAGTWYTVKFRAEADGKKAILKGKVWEMGKSEPDEWTIEAVDEAGNTQGSPGLFGNAKDAEIYYGRVSVTPN